MFPVDSVHAPGVAILKSPLTRAVGAVSFTGAGGAATTTVAAE